MLKKIILVEKQKDWLPSFPEAEIITAQDYLSGNAVTNTPKLSVINLCRSYNYLSTGYYCSLLADPRGHRVLPTIKTVTKLSSKSVYNLDIDDLDEAVQKSIKNHGNVETKKFDTIIFFGQCPLPKFDNLAHQLFSLFQCPLLQVEFSLNGHWKISSLKPLYLSSLKDEHKPFFCEAFENYIRKPWRRPRSRSVDRYDIAILYNKDEKLPPSNKAALNKFIRAGQRQNVNVELIEKKDFSRLGEFDALFIRETTAIDHHTYRFAQKARIEGMPVIDDPNSIVRCANKVYLAELFKKNKIPCPKTIILQKGQDPTCFEEMGFPIILKIPDGSFSRGMYKVKNKEEFMDRTSLLFRESDLILAQEYVYTDYDWRIGILNNKAIFACQYFMSKKHWQIVRHEKSGRTVGGAFKSFALDQVPPIVINTALASAKLIGDGLYGVDLKMTDKGVRIIEINDNPNIDAGVEDVVMKNALYDEIITEFIRRIELRHNNIPNETTKNLSVISGIGTNE